MEYRVIVDSALLVKQRLSRANTATYCRVLGVRGSSCQVPNRICRVPAFTVHWRVVDSELNWLRLGICCKSPPVRRDLMRAPSYFPSRHNGPRLHVAACENPLPTEISRNAPSLQLADDNGVQLPGWWQLAGKLDRLKISRFSSASTTSVTPLP